jgi:hypothetical protein
VAGFGGCFGGEQERAYRLEVDRDAFEGLAVVLGQRRGVG